MSVRISVESLSGCAWNGCPSQRGIRRHEWYSKAEERGAKPGSIESEIRSLLGRMPPEQREFVVGQLLSIDPVQYAWLRKKSAYKA